MDTWTATGPPELRRQFKAFEQSLTDLIAGKLMLVACSYSVAESTAVEMLDVARTHQFAVARRRSQWEMMEAPVLAETQAVLERVNAELESGVDARTGQLADANAALKRMTEQLRALAARHRFQQDAADARIARHLRDELGSDLASLRWGLEGICESGVGKARQTIKPKIRTLMHLTDRMLDSIARVASGLRPSMLDDLGLVDVVEWQAQEFRRKTGIQCRCSLDVEGLPLGLERSTDVYRIVDEALTNVKQHAGALAVEIGLRMLGNELVVTIQDDGRGFSLAEASKRSSLGVLGMQERARNSGGTFRIESQPSKGTRIEVRIPTQG
jgi:signal transduction histidine kinase